MPSKALLSFAMLPSRHLPVAGNKERIDPERISDQQLVAGELCFGPGVDRALGNREKGVDAITLQHANGGFDLVDHLDIARPRLFHVRLLRRAGQNNDACKSFGLLDRIDQLAGGHEDDIRIEKAELPAIVRLAIWSTEQMEDHRVGLGLDLLLSATPGYGFEFYLQA